LEPFGHTFCHFFTIFEVLLDGTPSQAKHHIFMFWQPLDPISGSTYTDIASRG
jgi:hypothetical protein